LRVRTRAWPSAGLRTQDSPEGVCITLDGWGCTVREDVGREETPVEKLFDARSKRVGGAALVGGLALAILALVVSLLSSGGQAGAGPNPPGNNGTIKIDDVVFDDAPNNEPHVGCTFQVDFYGYDEGDLFAGASDNTLRNNNAIANGTGVFVGSDAPGTDLVQNVANNNAGNGFTIGSAGTYLERNVANSNGGFGILAPGGFVDGGKNVARNNGAG